MRAQPESLFISPSPIQLGSLTPHPSPNSLQNFTRLAKLQPLKPLDMDGASAFRHHSSPTWKETVGERQEERCGVHSSGAAQHEMNFRRRSETLIHTIVWNQIASRKALSYVCLSKHGLVQEHYRGPEVACSPGLANGFTKGETAQEDELSWNQAASFHPNWDSFSVLAAG